MRKPLISASPAGRAAVAELFERAAPILVEVRFPGCGTSADWHLSEAEEQLNEVSCLNVVTNAVVLWNTVYMSAVLDQLRQKATTSGLPGCLVEARA